MQLNVNLAACYIVLLPSTKKQQYLRLTLKCITSQETGKKEIKSILNTGANWNPCKTSKKECFVNIVNLYIINLFLQKALS